MKSDKIVKLIADAYRVGKAEGLVVGHKDGYGEGLLDGDEQGYDRGYEEGYLDAARAAERAAEDEYEDQDGPEFEITLEDEDDDGECECFICADPVAYDAGWHDGYHGEEEDEDMLKNNAYMAGYQCGAAVCTYEREIH